MVFYAAQARAWQKPITPILPVHCSWRDSQPRVLPMSATSGLPGRDLVHDRPQAA
jgi:hypothetical protein